eukprot:TRINITY_DN7704_c0_g1_i1.p1 TRINITY_DN7704_c0_g1~~TRINITY_DN7704_c0_g1_i1.p1  ORF type:complete len:412 (+),score=141.23 TRINITY_DN7704_c0_g1_i1:89-1237(+)
MAAVTVAPLVRPGSPTPSPKSVGDWQDSASERNDSSSSQLSLEEGTPGPSVLSVSGVSVPPAREQDGFKPQLPPPAIPHPQSWLHEPSGLRLLPLHLADRDSAVDMYCALQCNGAIFKALGLQGEQLRKYAEFMVDIGRAEPWNVCAIDDNGKVLGMVIFIRRADAEDASALPPLALDHWRIFIELERTFKEKSRGSVDTSGCLCCVFLGMLPEHQGKGLYGALNLWQADAAAAMGFNNYWSWTLNPNVLKAIGKGDGGLAVVVRFTPIFFKLPPWLMNNTVIPALETFGLVPRGLRAFWVPLRELGIERLSQGACAGINPMVSANYLVTTEVKQKAAAVKAASLRKARRRVIRWGIAMAALLVSLMVALGYGRSMLRLTAQ